MCPHSIPSTNTITFCRFLLSAKHYWLIASREYRLLGCDAVWSAQKTVILVVTSVRISNLVYYT